eukprot:221475-Chlamydomonas_euryale.AAC.15
MPDPASPLIRSDQSPDQTRSHLPPCNWPRLSADSLGQLHSFSETPQHVSWAKGGCSDRSTTCPSLPRPWTLSKIERTLNLSRQLNENAAELVAHITTYLTKNIQAGKDLCKETAAASQLKKHERQSDPHMQLDKEASPGGIQSEAKSLPAALQGRVCKQTSTHGLHAPQPCT